MFIVIETTPDKYVDLQKRIFDREKWGYSQKYHVAAQGEVFLTHEAATAWIVDDHAHSFKNKKEPRLLTIKEI